MDNNNTGNAGESHQEYDEGFITVLEGVWGEAFLSPGGPDTYERALRSAGFQNIELNSRNAWYRTRACEERDNLAGPLYEELKAKTDSTYIDHMIDIWDKMIIVLDQGELCPTHLRAQKPL